MIALIDLYQKELLKVNGFAPSTVETYTINIRAFCHFAKDELKINPIAVDGLQLQPSLDRNQVSVSGSELAEPFANQEDLGLAPVAWARWPTRHFSTPLGTLAPPRTIASRSCPRRRR